MFSSWALPPQLAVKARAIMPHSFLCFCSQALLFLVSDCLNVMRLNVYLCFSYLDFIDFHSVDRLVFFIEVRKFLQTFFSLPSFKYYLYTHVPMCDIPECLSLCSFLSSLFHFVLWVAFYFPIFKFTVFSFLLPLQISSFPHSESFIFVTIFFKSG
jgi:hypothetical protein